MKKIIFLSIIFFSAQSLSGQSQSNLAGSWKGQIDVPGKSLPFKTHFKKQGHNLKGTVDIQGVTLSLQKISKTNNDSVFFEFRAGPGLAKFKGSFQSDSTITGAFHQNGLQFPFTLGRYKPNTDTANSKTVLPYHHKDLIIQSDSVEIGGTLTQPEDQKANQLVIMISGSGAQNRDEEIVGFKPFALLSDSLTRAGIATFRYDDRGIGKSTGNFTAASLDMLASDVETIIDYFKEESDNKFNQIVLLGHSQGGVVGGKVAAKDARVDKLILMSSPAETLAKTVIEQVRILNEEEQIPDSIIAENLTMQRAIFDTLRGSQDFSKIEDILVRQDVQNYKQNGDSSSAKSISKPEAYFQKKEQGELQYMQSPSYFSFLDYDPAKDLSKLHIPVLVLFGGKDTQVPIRLNKAPLQKALDSAGVSYQLKVFEDANHLYQKAKTGSVHEYNELKKEFVGGFTSTIITWIKRGT